MSHIFGPPETVKYACGVCNCEDHPDCSFEGEFCDTCIDGNTGQHLLMVSDGTAMSDVPEWYRLCEQCNEYVDPDDEEDCPGDGEEYR